MGLGPKVFVRNNQGKNPVKLYKWSPGGQEAKIKKGKSSAKYFCVSPNGSQGNDFISTYSYVIVVLNGVAERHPYVQCDYVK